MFTTHSSQVWWEGQSIGPASGLIVPHNELKTLTEKDHVYHTSIPHNIDGLFVVGDKVVGWESKKPPDLVASHANGRLARQVSTLLDTVDLPILVRRGFDAALVAKLITREAKFSRGWKGAQLWEDLIRYQSLGMFIIDAADTDRAVKRSLGFAKSALGGSPVRAVARREAGPKERKPGWLLRRIPGIGLKTSSNLYEQYGTTIACLLGSSDGSWTKSERLRKIVEEALK